MTSPGTQANADGDTIYLPLSATDSAGNPITFTASNLPDGLSIDPDSGVISGTISAGDDAHSPYSVTVTATDDFDASSTADQTFDWTVSSTGTITVTLTQPADQTNVDEYSPTLTLSATDLASNSLVYGASNLPAGLSINSSTGVISGTITEGDSADAPYLVTVTATDSTNSSIGASQTFLWTVNPIVALSVPSSVTDADGESVFWHMAGNDSATDPMVYTASNLPAGLTINSYTGVISGTISAGDHSSSPYTVTVTATDAYDDSAYDTESFTWNVDSSYSTTASLTQPSDQSITAGSFASLSVSASDSASNPFIYSAIGLPPGMQINAITGVISGTPLYSDGGCSYAAIVTVGDAVNTGTEAVSTPINFVVAQPPRDIPGNLDLRWARGFPNLVPGRNSNTVNLRGIIPEVPQQWSVSRVTVICVADDQAFSSSVTFNQPGLGRAARFDGAYRLPPIPPGTDIQVFITVQIVNSTNTLSVTNTITAPLRR